MEVQKLAGREISKLYEHQKLETELLEMERLGF